MKIKLSIIIPHYKEGEEVIIPLLETIWGQQRIDKQLLEVIIVNDGDEYVLSDEFIQGYKKRGMKLKYVVNEHKGVSATRNKGLDLAKGSYVMFCDADDCFYTFTAIQNILEVIYKTKANFINCAFWEETDPTRTNPMIPDKHLHLQDLTFVHGKVFKKSFLTKNKLRFNEEILVHEDAYFVGICQLEAKSMIQIPEPLYLWCWRDASVCRRDPDYILKTYPYILKACEAYINECKVRKRTYAMRLTQCVFDSYFQLNKKEWLEKSIYKDEYEKLFAVFWKKYKQEFEKIDEILKNTMIMGIKQRMFQEGLILESITFNDWIKHIEELCH